MSFQEKYGIKWPADLSAHMIELYAWANYDSMPIRELPRWNHLKNAILLMDKDMREGWNDWTEKMCWAYGTYDYIAALGCTSSTKTHTFHKLGMFDYISAPLRTVMTCTTTNSAGLEQRMWPIVSSTYSLIKKSSDFSSWKLTVAPQKVVKPSPNETKTVVRAVTIDPKADKQQIVDQLIGVHAPRRIWIVDEATSAPPAILDAWANAMASTTHRRFIQLGNPDDQADALASFCRPNAGWDSVTEDTEDWEFDFYGGKGIGLHFHGKNSPNIKYGPLSSGKDRWPFMYDNNTYQSHLRIKESNPTTYYRFCVGWFMPEGVSRRVCSMAAIDRYKCKEKPLFKGGDTKLFASLDPAFGGDRCMFMTWQMGYDNAKRKTVMYRTGKHNIPVDPRGLAGEQIGRKVLEICRKEGIKTIGIDTTTNNSEVAAWLTEHSDLKVLWITFGGPASEDRVVSPNDDRKCRDAYFNKAAELAFTVSYNLELLHGIDNEDAIELCSRYWESVGEKPSRQKIEPKREYKERMKQSPDNADCIAIGMEVFRQMGGMEVRQTSNRSNRWNNAVQKKNRIYSSNGAYGP